MFVGASRGGGDFAVLIDRVCSGESVEVASKLLYLALRNIQKDRMMAPVAWKRDAQLS